jgi:hypothetical protein
LQDSQRHARGGLIAYSLLHEDPAQQGADAVKNTRMKHADLVVFESRQGGRGVRVRTAKSDALILVFVRSSRCLHGNPINEEPNNDVPGVLHGRLVHYGLQKIDMFVQRMAANRTLLDLVKDDAKVDPFLRTRVEHIETSLPNIWNLPPVPEPAVEMPQPAAALMHVRTPISGLRRTRHPVTPTSHVSSVASSSINSLELWSRSSDAG